jgi:hypothetical protein
MWEKHAKNTRDQDLMIDVVRTLHNEVMKTSAGLGGQQLAYVDAAGLPEELRWWPVNFLSGRR